MDFNYIFGPVPSGRLGRSLGLDLLGRPICDFDCLYCEVGKTRVHTLARQPWVRAEAILTELENWLSLGLPRPEYITLGGKGEPCLNSEMAAVIQGVHRLAPDIPVAVLTNGTLLGNPEVQQALKEAQVVLPSMDTLIEQEFVRLNRPCPGLDLEAIRTGILEWGAGYGGAIYLEILLVAGINDSEANLQAMGPFCKALAPDRIDVVTMTRPGAFSVARPVDQATLDRWRQVLNVNNGSRDFLAHVRQSANFQSPATMTDDQLTKAILHSIAIRPQTVPQIAMAMGVREERVGNIIEHLATKRQITGIPDAGTMFYALADQDREKTISQIF
ncbi:radical SAM protein [Desulfoplanes formicivorans]|uniref:Radical SAM protein n=1 Tax=Desulfoplanes formicivorans TaxID=1592317 RepID=A0A194AF19_9BACT|nr:radical SAM protein [Desulfoplanes formicivorans]GAU07928.1 radical SAM protein [Desulfoplanes formicivorans]